MSRPKRASELSSKTQDLVGEGERKGAMKRMDVRRWMRKTRVLKILGVMVVLALLIGTVDTAPSEALDRGIRRLPGRQNPGICMNELNIRSSL